MNIANTLAEFGRTYGFGSVALNASNMARLEFEQGMAVDLEYREGSGLYLCCAIAALPEKAPAALLRAMLEANAPMHNPEAFVLSIVPGGQTLLLNHRIEDGRLTPGELARALEGFLDLVECWREQVRTPFPPDDPEKNDAPTPGKWRMRA